MWLCNWLNVWHYKESNNNNDDDNNNLKQNSQRQHVPMVPVGDSLWKLMQWGHKVGRIFGLIGECKKVKGYKRVHALSHTEIVWFESSDKHN